MQTKIIIISYFIGVLLLGIYSFFKIKTPADYYIAGKKAGIIPVSGSLLATILGGSAILGTIELSKNIGWAALWFLFCASIGLFLLLPLSKKVNRFGNFTLPELLGKFYGKPAERIASIIIPLAWLGIIAAQIIAAAKIINGLQILSYSNAAITAGLIFILYTFIGGQHSILKTDTLQSVLIISGLVFIFLFALENKSNITIEPFRVEQLFNSSFKVIDLVILLLTYSVTFVVGPDIYSRIFCAKNENTAKKSILIVAVTLIPISFILTYLGIYSLQSETQGLVTFAEHLLPGWIYGLFIAALLSAVMSSADTTLLTSSMVLSELFTGNLNLKKALNYTRLFIVILGAGSIVISLFIDSIIQSLLFALTFFSGAFAVPVITGLLQIKIENKRVVPAIIFGGLTALAGKYIGLTINELAGNLLVVFAFFINAAILFFPAKGFTQKPKQKDYTGHM